MRSSMNVKTSQKGFTLIELVVVIVILGILAVTAAPRFINLQSDANTATLQAIKASMETASTLVHSKSLIAGSETAPASATPADNPTVVVDSTGTTVNLDLGYPISTSATPLAAATDWGNLLDVNANDFIISDSAITGFVVVYPTGRTAPTAFPADITAPTAAEDDCFAFYQETAAVGVRPAIDVVVCL